MRSPPPITTPASRADRPLLALPRAALVRTIRIYMERDPIILFSCTIGLFGGCPLAREKNRKPHGHTLHMRPRRNPRRHARHLSNPMFCAHVHHPHILQALPLPSSLATAAVRARRMRRATRTGSSTSTRPSRRAACWVHVFAARCLLLLLRCSVGACGGGVAESAARATAVIRDRPSGPSRRQLRTAYVYRRGACGDAAGRVVAPPRASPRGRAPGRQAASLSRHPCVAGCARAGSRTKINRAIDFFLR